MTQALKLGNAARGTAVSRNPDLVRRGNAWVHVKVCEYVHCDTIFVTPRSLKKYCSIACGERHRGMVKQWEVTCSCGEDFITHRPNQVKCKDCIARERARHPRVVVRQNVSISLPEKLAGLLPEKRVSNYIEEIILAADFTDLGNCRCVSVSLGVEARQKLQALGKRHRSRAVQLALMVALQAEGKL